MLLCGGPLHNVRALLDRHPDVAIDRWVVQGGFAGDNLVAPEDRLAKFAGKTMTESHNFGANKKATLAVLASPRVRDKRLVSKNVTHGVLWDAEMQRAVAAHAPKTRGVAMMEEAMRLYLAEAPDGKALHDPLAACAAIDPAILTWAEVEVTYEAGRWGAERRDGTGTFISTAVDRAAFMRTLLAG